MEEVEAVFDFRKPQIYHAMHLNQSLTSLELEMFIQKGGKPQKHMLIETQRHRNCELKENFISQKVI